MSLVKMSNCPKCGADILVDSEAKNSDGTYKRPAKAVYTCECARPQTEQVASEPKVLLG